MPRSSRKTVAARRSVPTQDYTPPASRKRAVVCVLMIVTIAMVAANLLEEVRNMTEWGKVLIEQENRQSSLTVTKAVKDGEGKLEVPAKEAREPPTTIEIDPEALERRRDQAALGLQEMQTNRVFEAPFTTPQKVMLSGFPTAWNQCALERRFQQEPGSHLHVSVVGGSTAARPGNNCPDPTTQTDGRYSALLDQKLQPHQDLKFSVRNLAQGGTTSVVASFLLDGLIDPLETDIIVWDFLVNDTAYNGGMQETVRKLDFFLTRVQKLYAHAKRPPPPIVLLYLWRDQPRNWLINNSSLNGKVGMELVQKYIDLGWNIAIVNVGATIASASLRDNPDLLLDDNHHPSCKGTNLIADMIRHLFYTNIQQCTLEALQLQPPLGDNTLLEVPPHAQTWAETTTPRKELWNDLFEGKVGSISAWVPQTPSRTTLLKVESLHAIDRWQKRVLEKADGGRDDRKFGFLLPKCLASGFLLLPLKEPNLRWLGFSLEDDTKLEINSKPVPTTKDATWNFGVTRITHWIQITPEMQSTSYEIMLCNTIDNQGIDRHLQYIIGVSVEDPSGQPLAST